MGRAKGSVELVLNKEQVDEVCGYINVSIPETVKGAMDDADSTLCIVHDV
jgi:hypothetical protein